MTASPSDINQSAAALGNPVIRPLGNGQTEIISTLPRTDVVDAAIGLKYNVYGRAVVFGSAIVPLNDDGIRAPVIPAAGVEVSF